MKNRQPGSYKQFIDNAKKRGYAYKFAYKNGYVSLFVNMPKFGRWLPMRGVCVG